MIDIERVKEKFADVLNDVVKIFTGVNIEDPSMNNLRRCLKILLIIKTSKNISLKNTQNSEVCLSFFLQTHF